MTVTMMVESVELWPAEEGAEEGLGLSEDINTGRVSCQRTLEVRLEGAHEVHIVGVNTRRMSRKLQTPKSPRHIDTRDASENSRSL